MNPAQRLGAVVAALGLLALPACSGDEDPRSDPGSSATSPRATAPGGSDPGASATSGDAVESSSGPELATDNASLRAPEGWKVDTRYEALGVLGATTSSSDAGVYLGDLGTVSSTTLKQMVRVSGLTQFQRRPEVTFDSELGGEAAYHASGREGGTVLDEYGALHDGTAVNVTFRFSGDQPADERREVIESVLASFVWS